jgi:hypothetical protein
MNTISKTNQEKKMEDVESDMEHQEVCKMP